MKQQLITLDFETIIQIVQEEQPKIRAYLEKKMDLVPPGGVTRELFGLMMQELSELMFTRGAGRMMHKLRGELPVADIDGIRQKTVVS